jgi:prevent-host-death family protein
MLSRQSSKFEEVLDTIRLKWYNMYIIYTMGKIIMPITTLGSREARQKWRDVLDEVYTGAADIVIERNGKPLAVLIPYEDYLAVAEALDNLRAARRVAAVYKTSQQSGRSYDEIREDLKGKGLLDD